MQLSLIKFYVNFLIFIGLGPNPFEPESTTGGLATKKTTYAKRLLYNGYCMLWFLWYAFGAVNIFHAIVYKAWLGGLFSKLTSELVINVYFGTLVLNITISHLLCRFSTFYDRHATYVKFREMEWKLVNGKSSNGKLSGWTKIKTTLALSSLITGILGHLTVNVCSFIFNISIPIPHVLFERDNWNVVFSLAYVFPAFNGFYVHLIFHVLCADLAKDSFEAIRNRLELVSHFDQSAFRSIMTEYYDLKAGIQPFVCQASRMVFLTAAMNVPIIIFMLYSSFTSDPLLNVFVDIGNKTFIILHVWILLLALSEARLSNISPNLWSTLQQKMHQLWVSKSRSKGTEKATRQLQREVDHYLMAIQADPISVSVGTLFPLQNSTILTVVSIVVTYLIVLLQFPSSKQHNNDDPAVSQLCNCTINSTIA